MQPNNTLDTPDGFGLACKHCGHLFPGDVTMGVVAAHFEIEHDDGEIELELSVLCPRCQSAMALERKEGNHTWWGCSTCHRTRKVTQNDGGDSHV